MLLHAVFTSPISAHCSDDRHFRQILFSEVRTQQYTRMWLTDSVPIPGQENLPALPPVIAGAFRPEIQERVENLFHSVAGIFEAWVNRRKSDHTRRAYRGDVMAFRRIPRARLAA
jgi:hypothetical protein